MQTNRNECQQIRVGEQNADAKKKSISSHNDPHRGTDGMWALSSDVKNSNSSLYHLSAKWVLAELASSSFQKIILVRITSADNQTADIYNSISLNSNILGKLVVEM